MTSGNGVGMTSGNGVGSKMTAPPLEEPELEGAGALAATGVTEDEFALVGPFPIEFVVIL